MTQQYYQFADLEWQSRWNDPTKPCVDLYREGSKLRACGLMGILRMDLSKTADIEAIVQKLSRFALAISDAKRQYDEVMEALQELPNEADS